MAKHIESCLQVCADWGLIPTEFRQCMTWEEQVIWLQKFLKDTVIPAFNGMSDEVNELEDWFNNLDVQEEINNKLEQMAEDGELADIIAQYLQLAGVLVYGTIAEMAAAENLANGSICRVLGNTNEKDGNGDYYKVRELINTDVIDGVEIVALAAGDNLVAERINNALSKYYIIEDIEVNHYVNEDAENGNTDYWVTHIPHTDSRGNFIELKHGLSGDATTAAESGLNENGLQFAHRHHTTLCANASGFIVIPDDPYYHKPMGPLILNGTLISNNPIPDVLLSKVQILGIKRDNTLKAYANTTTPSELINDGVYNTVIAFDQLLDGDERIGTDTQTLYAWHLIGQNSETKDIYFFTCNGGNIRKQPGMLLDDCVTVLENAGCDFVYRLDQGGSTTLVYEGEMLNTPIDDYGQTIRKVGDFLYFSKDLSNKSDVAEAELQSLVGDAAAGLSALSNKVRYLNEIDNSQLIFHYPNVRVNSGDGGCKIYYKKNGANSSAIVFDRDDAPQSLRVVDTAASKTVTNIDGTACLLQVGDGTNAKTIKLDGSDGSLKVGAKTYADVCSILTRQADSFSPDAATTTSTYYVPYAAGQSPANRPYTVPYVLQTFAISQYATMQIAWPYSADFVSGTLKAKVRIRVSGTWGAWGSLN